MTVRDKIARLLTRRFMPICCVLFLGTSCVSLLQKPDKKYNISVEIPTYRSKSPKIIYDEAHLNTHKANSTYRPFIDLITNDGCTVTTNTEEFSQGMLANCDMLIICNAKSDKSLPQRYWCFYEKRM